MSFPKDISQDDIKDNKEIMYGFWGQDICNLVFYCLASVRFP